MGNYCSLAPGVQVGGGEHAWWWGSTSQRLVSGYDKLFETVIEDDVWIGTNAVIRQGIKIGRGAVIGACALVLEDMPPYSISFGCPAKVIKMRFQERIINQLENIMFWKYSPDKAQSLLDTIEYPDRFDSKGFTRRKNKAIFK
jgi:acetyltransferase-like isoleucine patch superfamily enzyme